MILLGRARVEKILYIVIFITLSLCINLYAKAEQSLPALPEDTALSSSLEENQEEQQGASWWSRTKAFFGFGGNDSPINEEVHKPVSEEIAAKEELILNNNLAKIDEHLEIPKLIESDLEGPGSMSAENISKEPVKFQETNFDKDDSLYSTQITQAQLEEKQGLSLPEGFDKILDIDNKVPGEELADNKEHADSVKLAESNSKQEPDLVINEDNKADIFVATEAPESAATDSTISLSENPKEMEIAEKNPIAENVDIAKEDNMESSNKDSDALISEASLPVPEYAGSANKEPVSKFDRLINSFKENKNSKEVAKVNEDDYSKDRLGQSIKKEAVEVDADQVQFINNEVQVLMLPNDDVVLGELTDEARIDSMDLHYYIKKFWQNYNKLKREPRTKELEKFIEDYEENFKT